MDPMSSGFDVQTFGCKVNTYDTGLLQKRLHAAGFVHQPDNPSIHILNSCAVTAEATKEAIRQARRIKSKNPLATVVLTGCAAQVDGALVDAVPAIDLVVANSHKNDLEDILKKHFRGELKTKVLRSNIFRNEQLGEGGGEEKQHTRSYLKIQDGCNSFCSFCVIPFARGKSRSLSVPMILDKIKELQNKGSNEVVLTGVHIGDYRDEATLGGPFALDDLVEQVLNNTQIPRVRLTSLEPIELTDKLMALFKNPRLCSHFHMSLQSLSTSVLTGMRRKYTAEQVGDALKWIERDIPEAFVGLDVIVGFPGETEELFQETYENLKKWPWSRIHVFPYSERNGTRANDMKDSVPLAVRKERAKLLRALSQERYDIKACEQIGQVKRVLMLNHRTDHWQGLSDDYWDVLIDKKGDWKPGRLHQVRIRGYERATMGRMNGFLYGEALDA
jgi:threonylcarbamoyladenosine tRNA methylthiotransferase MtaB